MQKIKALFVSTLFVDILKYIRGYAFAKNSIQFKTLDDYLYKLLELEKHGVRYSRYSRKCFSAKIELTSTLLRKSSSDLQVFDQIFLREEYKEALKIILQKLQINSGPVIIDAGANIGCSAIYLSRFEGLENSKVIALEPFPETAKLLKKNLSANLSTFEVAPMALWSKETSIRFDMNFRDGKEWSVRTVEDPNGQVKAVSIPKLMEQLDLKQIDIFKIDIEGSEFEVFLNSRENVKCLINIRSVIMEIHDDAGERTKLYPVFTESGFEIIELGELTLFLNKSFLRS
ncbi:MAG: FkbM family methyltransferase [Bacteroidetes bacterium]|nr:MAG: FkbM family methyltransferase [Bacteroidota bacterium]